MENQTFLKSLSKFTTKIRRTTFDETGTRAYKLHTIFIVLFKEVPENIIYALSVFLFIAYKNNTKL